MQTIKSQEITANKMAMLPMLLQYKLIINYSFLIP